MRLTILSQAPKCYSTKRLVAAAQEREHAVRVMDNTRFTLILEHGRPSMMYRGKKLFPCDAIIPRIRASVTFFGTAVVRQFGQMGLFCLNSAEAITASRDKLRTMQLLSRYNIGIAPTAFVRCNKYILPAIESVGGAPVVLKLIQGTQGIGVILAETQNVAEAILQTLRTARQNVLIQKFVAESKGKDIRALVVGDRVVAAMKRVAQGQDFRSNVHRGGKAQPITLTREYEATAIRAANILGLHVAGVDMLEGEAGPLVAEVNSSPGLEGIEKATGVDVAGAIIEYLEAQVALAVDAEQTDNEHFEMIELVVSNGSEFVGETVEGPKLAGRGLVVLKLFRNGEEVVRPTGNSDIREGDRLLCFGRSRELNAVQKPQALSQINGSSDVSFEGESMRDGTGRTTLQRD